MLSNGCLTWSTYAFSLDELFALPEGAKKSMTIDFSQTPCEAVAASAHAHQIALRPVKGHLWSEKEGHSGAGTDRTFLLDVADSGAPRAAWIQRFSEHISFARGGRSGSEGGEEEGTVLGALGHVATSFFDFFGMASNPEFEPKAQGPVQSAKDAPRPRAPTRESLPGALRRATSIGSQSTAVTTPFGTPMSARPKLSLTRSQSPPPARRTSPREAPGQQQQQPRARRLSSGPLAATPEGEGARARMASDDRPSLIRELTGQLRQARTEKRSVKGKEMFNRFA